MGDSRGTNSSNQINTNILAELARATTNEKPAFVLVPGDLVYSGSSAAFKTWTNAMGPVYQAGIPIYPVIGNHDLGDTNAYVQTFGAAIPDNGPAGEINRTYSIMYSNALILALDNYVSSGRVNQAWVNSVLASNYMPHVFAFGHMPAFKLNHADTLDDFPADRNAFWSSLSNAKVRAYFCGHDHFYDHVRLDDGDGNSTNDLHQYIVGTAGAPLTTDGTYNGNNGSWSPARVLHEQQYGYLVVDIDQLDVAMTWKHRIAANTFVASADIQSGHVVPGTAAMEMVRDYPTVILRFTGLTPSASNTVERNVDMLANNWTSWYPFVTYSNTYDLEVPPDAGTSYFRIRSQ